MTETFSGRIDGLDAEQYSTKHFEEMAQQNREAEEKRIEESAKTNSISVEFSVASWLTERESTQESLGKIIDILLKLGGEGRTTGNFTVITKLPGGTNDTSTGN